MPSSKRAAAPPRAKRFSFTQAQLDHCAEHHYQRGVREANERLRTEKQALEEQRARLSVQQTDAVTKLIEACNANLSKAGYLIGKLNKDTSR